MGDHVDDRRILEELKKLPRPRASARARERARSVFVTGEVEIARKGVPGWVNRLLQVSVPLAAAAGLALFFYGSRPVEYWRVTAVGERGEARSRGEMMVEGDRVTAGAIETSADGQVDVQLGETLRLQVTPGTRLELPPPPGRWFRRSVRIALDQGEIRGTSGGERLTFELVFETEEAVAQIHGTTFAVIRNEDGTCICNFLGSVDVQPHGAEQAIDVPEGYKHFVYLDERPDLTIPISDMERMKLGMLHDQGITAANGTD